MVHVHCHICSVLDNHINVHPWDQLSKKDFINEYKLLHWHHDTKVYVGKANSYEGRTKVHFSPNQTETNPVYMHRIKVVDRGSHNSQVSTLTAECCPGVRGLSHSSHLRQWECQSLPRITLRSAGERERERGREGEGEREKEREREWGMSVYLHGWHWFR